LKPDTGRYIGLDVGDARIGMAVSDPTGLIAIPMEVIFRKEGDVLERMRKIIESFTVTSIVVGLPKNMDGSEGIQARITRQFIIRLQKAMPEASIILRDERLSTHEARGKRLERGTSKSKRRMAIDSEAAAIILQNYLDFLNQHTR
jgi:putative Holliday junction resolvase